MAMFLTPKGFLTYGGAVLLLLGVLGLFVLGPTAEKSALGSFFWLDNAENYAHLLLGVVALAAVFVPGLNSALAPYYKWIVVLVGVIALFFGLYGFIASSATANANTFGITNLELSDNVLHLFVAAWAFSAAYGWLSSRSMARG